MKNILKIFTFFIVFLFGFSFISADLSKDVIYKKIAVSNTQIIKIYGDTKGKSVVKILDKFFTKIRGDKNKEKMNKIEKNVSDVLKKLDSKKILSRKEKNIKTILENIYYRNKILLEYLVK